MKQTDVVTKAAFAALLECPRGTVSRLCGRGMPVRPDGKVNTVEALRWITELTSGFKGGWVGRRRGKEDLNSRAARLLDGGSAVPQRRGFAEDETDMDLDGLAGVDGTCAIATEAQRVLLDRIRRNAAELLPAVARRLKLPKLHIDAALGIFDSLLAGCGADSEALDYEWPVFGEPGYYDSEEAGDFCTRLDAIFKRVSERPRRPRRKK